jgi:hypothetical protein
MNVAAIIVGIDGWQEYTLPLVESIRKHESSCRIVIIDNESEEPYPYHTPRHVVRTNRLSYSKAINLGKEITGDADWYIVLSNDVLCTGPFADILEYGYDDSSVVGPALKETHGFPYIEGWAVAIPRRIWDACGGWDERFLGSDWEDVAFSTKARQKGYYLTEDLPFKHLDQRQRYTIVDDFWGKDAHNRDLFLREYAAVTA